MHHLVTKLLAFLHHQGMCLDIFWYIRLKDDIIHDLDDI